MKNIPARLSITGYIDEEQYSQFISELYEFEKSKTPVVYVDICSQGGDSQVALAYYSRMRLSPCRIVTTAYGVCASAAVLLLAAGKHRRMTKESWVMVHEEQFSEEDTVFSGPLEQVEQDVRQYRLFESQWCVLLQEATQTSFKTWTALHKKETYLTPDRCLFLNLVSEII